MKINWPNKNLELNINWEKFFFKISLVMCVGSFLLGILLLYAYWQEKDQAVKTAKETAKREALRAVQKIDADLRRLSSSAQAIADDLTSGQLKDKDLVDRIKTTMVQNPDFFGVGAAYVPYAFSPDVRLYVPYYAKKRGQLQLTVTPDYEYTEPQHEWYNRPLKEGPVWLEPFYGKAAKVVLVEYSTPFYQIDPQTKQKKPKGVVYADYSLAEIKSMMATLDLGKTGYGVILSKKGNYLYHPDEEFVKNGKNIFDVAAERNNEQIKEIGEKAISGESGVIEVVDKVTGRDSWVFFEPISSTGWSMGVTLFQNEIIINNKSGQRKLLALTLTAVSFFFFLSILLFRAYTGKIERLWAVVYCSNVLYLAGIGFLWYLALTDRNYENGSERRIVLSSPAGLNQYLNSREEIANRKKLEKPIYIPTGVFIQSLEFNTANNVTLTGYIWQKFSKGKNNRVTPGFILPEGVSVKITDTYRVNQKDGEIYGWYFEAKVRQNFDYSRYPLDYKDVWLRIWPKDFDKNIMLVPDLGSYEVTNPTLLPGIEKDFVLAGWGLESSFFEYALNSYNVNFGVQNHSAGQKEIPELYFTMVVRRNLLPIFISNLMPLAVVSFMLFGLLMLVRPKTGGSFLGVTAKDFVTAGSGFMFIVLINQSNLRAAISAPGIIYIEYFYFVFYILILLVVINAILLGSNVKFPLLQYEENAIPKLLYWPTLLGLLLLITVGVFY